MSYCIKKKKKKKQTNKKTKKNQTLPGIDIKELFFHSPEEILFRLGKFVENFSQLRRL